MSQQIYLKGSLLFIFILQSFFANTQSYDRQFMADLKSRVIKGDKADESKWFAYEGQLGEGRTVYVLLNEDIFDPKGKEKKRVWGEYFYKKYHKTIQLEGQLKGAKIDLKEIVEGKQIGKIVFDGDKNTGLWMNLKGKEYPLELNTIDLEEYVQEYYADQSSRISNPSFRSFVQEYRNDITPTVITIEDDFEDKIEDKMAAKYLDKELLKMQKEYEMMTIEYFYGTALFQEQYFTLFSVEHSTPNAAGVDDYFIWVHTFSYDGKLISKQNLGCDCTDNGMNTEYSSSILVLADWSRLMVYLGNNTMDFELDKTTRNASVRYYKLEDKGKVIKQ